MTGNYDWQEETFDKWKNNGFRGLLRGVVSAGKTRAGCKTIVKYLEFFGYDCKVWIVAPTNEILEQWKSEPMIKGFDVSFLTYISALNRLIKETKLDKYNVPDLIVLDEAHTALARQSGRVLEFGIPHILALSGTPNGIEKAVGGIFQEVSWDCANIAPTDINYLFFKPTKEEMDKYKKSTASIAKYREDHPYANMWNDQILQLLYLRRRDLVYKFKSRLPIALSLLKKHNGERVMVFFERKKQVMDFSKILNAEGIDHCIHISGNEHLDEYLNGSKNIVLCCKKLKQGFSDPTTTIGVVVSTGVGNVQHIQTVGRILRPMEGKHGQVYIILADETSDLELYGKRGQMFPKDMIHRIDWEATKQ